MKKFEGNTIRNIETATGPTTLGTPRIMGGEPRRLTKVEQKAQIMAMAKAWSIPAREIARMYWPYAK